MRNEIILDCNLYDYIDKIAKDKRDFIWGNSEDDPTNAWERITGSYQGNVNATKEEALQLRAKKNEENRNKAMEQYYEHH